MSVNAAEECYTRFANNGITNAGFAERRNILISSTRDGKTGVIRIDEIDDDALRAAVKRSEVLAAIAPPNPEHQPPPGPQKYPEIAALRRGYRAGSFGADDPSGARRRGSRLGEEIVAAGLFERSQITEAVANKAGLFGYHRSADSRMSTTIRYPDGSSSGWAGQPAARIRDISGAALAATAMDKCIQWRNPKRLEPGKFTVVFEPTAAGDIVRLIIGGGFGGVAEAADSEVEAVDSAALSARAPRKRAAPSSARRAAARWLGEKLFPDFITLAQRSRRPASACWPWSGDLLPNRPVTWVEKGVIKNLQYDRYWASRTGREPSPLPSTVIMDGGDASLEDLIKGVDRGLLVTHFWYIRFVNQQTVQHTGLTRDGLFLIENGKITQPVMNFRFNDSPVNLLKNAVKLGRPVRVRGLEGAQMIVPAIVSRDFSFTSISDAV